MHIITVSVFSDLMPETQISLHQRLTVKLNGKKIFLPLRTAYYVIENVRGYVELKSTAGDEKQLLQKTKLHQRSLNGKNLNCF